MGNFDGYRTCSFRKPDFAGVLVGTPILAVVSQPTAKRLQFDSMWDEQDHLGRWVQGICAIVLGMGAVGAIYMATHSTLIMLRFGGLAATLGCIRISWRCAGYAITGRNNINRDDF